jgi:DNA-binding SARP family transcriptional activator
MAITTQQLARQLGELRRDQRIVCVHPNFKAPHQILNTLWDHAAYVRLQGTSLGVDAVLAHLEASLLRQTGQAALDGSVQYLILDEADRALPDALQQVLSKLLAESQETRLVVLSRVVFDGLVADAELKRQTVFLPIGEREMLWDYARPTDGVLLEVRAFGEGRVHLNGKPVASWDGALPRSLFFYLIDRGMVTRAEIFQTFWPTLSTREATNVFHVTKRKISEVLRTELTVYGSSFYHISPRIQLIYDVSLFNQALQESDSEDERGAAALRDALALYRGDYLTSLPAPWVRARRDALQQAACDALVGLGKIYEAEGRPEEALGAYLRASRLRPGREDSAYGVMRLYRDLKMPQDGLIVYRQLAKTLHDNFRVEPSLQIQQLAAQLGQ